MKIVQHHLRKFVLSAYKTLGIITLYGVLLGVVAYIGMTLFYAANSTWVAPFIITPTNEKILDMTEKLVESQQSLNALVVDRDRLQGSMGDMLKTKAELDILDKNFQDAIALQKISNKLDSPEITALNARKRADNAKTDRAIKEVIAVESKIDSDLRAGLITQSDAATAKVQLRMSQNTATDGKISEVLLRDVVRSKGPTYPTTADTLAKEAELKSTSVQLGIQIWSGQEQLKTDKTQIVELTRAIATAQGSPYFLATKGNVRFAFAEYGTNHVYAGVPVYGCWLNMIICHKVGVVERVFSDEERATHPVFHTDIRGIILQLNLIDTEAAKDTVLFLGHAPLWF
jgi:hypothetical protein